MQISLSLLSMLFTLALSGQQGISFQSLSLAEALDKAEKENKIIFVDAYTSFCKPCKIMNREFHNVQLGQYFNDHFVNIKVDLDAAKGRDYDDAYQIIFLPTLLFIDKDGQVLKKLEHLVSARELLLLGQIQTGDQSLEALSENYILTPAKSKVFAEAEKIKYYPVNPEKEAENKILHVLDDSGTIPDDILRQEAYFRMELMDGSHRKIAQQYLKTQENWLEEKNIRFLFDFLYTANSKEFEFFINNKEAFTAVLGKDRVEKSIRILVHKELDRGFPRPGFEKAKKLYGYIDSTTAIKKAANYHLPFVKKQKGSDVFLKEALACIDRYHLKDAHLYDLISKEYSARGEYKHAIAWIEKAIEIDLNEARFWLQKARILKALHQNRKAKKSAEKALQLSQSAPVLTNKILEFIHELNS